jgi:predicted nucleotidyltransferase
LIQERYALKTPSENTAKRLKRNQKGSRVAPIVTSKLPKDVQEFMEKFREWEESFKSPARRMGYIRRVCERIAEAYNPEKIILFGSHANGKPTKDSDVDLFIVMDYEGSPARQAIRITGELGLVTPMDILVRTSVSERHRQFSPPRQITA